VRQSTFLATDLPVLGFGKRWSYGAELGLAAYAAVPARVPGLKLTEVPVRKLALGPSQRGVVAEELGRLWLRISCRHAASLTASTFQESRWRDGYSRHYKEWCAPLPRSKHLWHNTRCATKTALRHLSVVPGSSGG
jgi:hypothetical protein